MPSIVTEKEDIIVGIDLGTTNSLVGVVDSGFPILLADGEGNRLLPSAVHFPAESVGEGAVVGMPALRKKSELLTGYLEWLLRRIPGDRFSATGDSCAK